MEKSQNNVREIEDFLRGQIEELSFIVNGLREHAPFLRLVEKWKNTNDNLDSSWHLFTDPVKFNEARITKFAAMELINTVSSLEADLARSKTELIKLQNQDQLINKDVDNE